MANSGEAAAVCDHYHGIPCMHQPPACPVHVMLQAKGVCMEGVSAHRLWPGTMYSHIPVCALLLTLCLLSHSATHHG